MQSWRTLSVPSSILAVVDASGSMDYDSPDGTRMDVLAEAAGIGLSFLPDHARVGLWVFSIDKGGPGQDWQVLEPIGASTTCRSAARSATPCASARADARPDRGRHGLYDTALAAYRQARAATTGRTTPTRSS